MKQQVKIFVSYAHKNRELAKKFIEEFYDYISASDSYEYVFWNDLELNAGEIWESKITEAIDNCDCGLMLISTSFLNSKYISEKELPTLLNKKKIIIPALLQKIDFEKHDLKGIEDYQIYRFIDDGFKSYRSYGELKPKRRLDYVAELFIELEERLK